MRTRRPDRKERIRVLLEDRNAVIYGGGGKVGGAVARTFAHEGAHVFLAGRTQAKLEKPAEQIRSAGGVAETAQVDALDREAVDRYVDAVAEKAGVSTSRSTSSLTGTSREHRWPRWSSKTSKGQSSMP